MKKSLLAAAAAAAIVTGCNQSQPGGNTKPTAPGSSASGSSVSNNPDVGSITGNKGTFTIDAPLLSTTVKQGDKQTVDLTLNRGSEFKETVKLEAEAPKGIKAELSKSSVAAGDPEKVSLSISADKDAPLGDHIIKVTGTPGTGTPTHKDVKVKVDEGAKK